MRDIAEFYIGSDPDNGEPDVEKIQEILRGRHDRFVVKGIFDGYWRGYAEDTYVVLVIDLAETIEETKKILEQQLNNAAVVVLLSDDLHLM